MFRANVQGPLQVALETQLSGGEPFYILLGLSHNKNIGHRDSRPPSYEPEDRRGSLWTWSMYGLHGLSVMPCSRVHDAPLYC